MTTEENAREWLEKAANAVPSNWLDPMLTGPNKVLRHDSDCRDIEAVLKATRARILALADELEKS